MTKAGTGTATAARGAAAIGAEVTRVRAVEGRSAAGDDAYASGELMDAARCYRASARGAAGPGAPARWPWDPAWFKPRGAERDLVRSGALARCEGLRRARAGLDPSDAVEFAEAVAAEIDALDAGGTAGSDRSGVLHG